MKLEEVNEKFKDAKVKFTSYYKYTFHFEGQTEDGYTLSCSYGGDSDDIYRFDVDTNEVSFNNAGEWKHVTVKDGKGEIVFNEHFDF
jgi:hypothetical protein